MEKTYKQIAELIRIELLKRGFVVNVTCTPTKDNSFKVKTNTFQTTPVLFSKVWIESWAANIVNKTENGVNYKDFKVTLSVLYETFEGGRNANDLFKIWFRQIEGCKEVTIISIK